LEYYRLVATREALDVRLYETVLDLHGTRGAFSVTTSRGTHQARHIVIATGFFDHPNRLSVPGADLPKSRTITAKPFRTRGSSWR